MPREPIAGELPRLGGVGGRHLRGNLVTVLDCIMITLSTREVEPHERLDIVRRHALALGLHDAWVPLRVGILLLGRQRYQFAAPAQPFRGAFACEAGY
jgi:hypothetical protein